MWKDREKLFQVAEIVFVLGWHLEKQTPELSTVIQWEHQLSKTVQLSFKGRTGFSQLVVSDHLWNFRAEEEVPRREPIPAQHRSRLGERVESGIDLRSGKNLGVVFQFTLGGGR